MTKLTTLISRRKVIALTAATALVAATPAQALLSDDLDKAFKKIVSKLGMSQFREFLVTLIHDLRNPHPDRMYGSYLDDLKTANRLESILKTNQGHRKERDA